MAGGLTRLNHWLFVPWVVHKLWQCIFKSNEFFPSSRTSFSLMWFSVKPLIAEGGWWIADLEENFEKWGYDLWLHIVVVQVYNMDCSPLFHFGLVKSIYLALYLVIFKHATIKIYHLPMSKAKDFPINTMWTIIQILKLNMHIGFRREERRK